MEEAVPAGVGAMAAVLGMDTAAIQAVIQNREGVWIANDNCPGQLVITGEKTAVEEAGILLKEAGARRVLPLKVSGPFHSPLLNTAGEKLAEVLAPCKLSGLKIPYISNTLAEPVTDKTKIKDLSDTADQLSGALEGEYGGAHPEGVGTFIEIGPGKTLSGFLKKIDRNADGLLHVRTDGGSGENSGTFGGAGSMIEQKSCAGDGGLPGHRPGHRLETGGPGWHAIVIVNYAGAAKEKAEAVLGRRSAQPGRRWRCCTGWDVG